MSERPLIALVLVGGRSRRMGEDKAALPFLGEPLLLRTLRLVRGIVAERIVVRRPGQALPELPADVVVLEDAVADRGPLAGLDAGFAARPEGRFLVLSCDLPLLEPRLLALLARSGASEDVVVPLEGGRPQPLCAVWSASSAPAIRAALREDRLSVTRLLGTLSVHAVPEPEWAAVDPEGRSFLNANHPEDLRRAEQLARDEAAGSPPPDPPR